jgi:uncharacterized delta-60 repeat protein
MAGPATLAVVLAISLPWLAAAEAGAAPGGLDGTFGTGGATLADAGNGKLATGSALALDPSGNLVVGGTAFDAGSFRLMVARFSPTGLPGTGFGSAGVAFNQAAGANSGASVAVQADGKPVVVGQAGAATVIARFGTDGTPDAGFGDANGLRSTQLGSTESAFDALALQPDGRAVAAGRADEDLVIARYAAGDPDASFNGGGSRVLAVGTPAGGIPPQASARAVVLAGGEVVAAGFARDGGALVFAVGRVSDDGGAVTTQTIPVGDGAEAIANALAIQPDGKLVLAGYASDGGRTKVAIVRLTAGGLPDTGFGTGGKVLLTAGDGDDAGANGVLIQPDGRILVAGYATDAGGTNVMLARLNADGSPDAGFGTGGIVLSPFGDEGLAEANAVVLQGLKATVTGYVGAAGANKVLLARYELGLEPPPGGGVPPPPADTTPPTLTARLSKKRFRAGKGTKIRYTLSEPARVTIRIQKGKAGRKVGRRCLKPTRARRGKPRCKRWVNLRTLTRESVQGDSVVPFSGRVRGRKLTPGPYRMRLSAVDAAGNRSTTTTLRFRVIK